MNIEVGDFRLCSDPYNFWIERKMRIKKDGEVVEKWARYTGYFSSWDKLFDSFINHVIRNSDATKFKQLLREVDEAKKEAVKAFSKLELPDEKEVIHGK